MSCLFGLNIVSLNLPEKAMSRDVSGFTSTSQPVDTMTQVFPDTTNRFIQKRWNKSQLTSRNVETPLLAFVLDIATIRPAQITKHGGKHHFQAVLINI